MNPSASTSGTQPLRRSTRSTSGKVPVRFNAAQVFLAAAKKSSDTKHSTMDDTTGDPKDKNSASTSKGTRTAKKASSLLEGLAFNSDEEDELPLALVKILRETKDVKPRKGPKKECRMMDDAWESLEPGYIQKTCAAFPKKMRQVIAASGGIIEK